MLLPVAHYHDLGRRLEENEMGIFLTNSTQIRWKFLQNDWPSQRIAFFGPCFFDSNETLNISVIVDIWSGCRSSVHCGEVQMTALPIIERCSNVSKCFFAFALTGLSLETHFVFMRRYQNISWRRERWGDAMIRLRCIPWGSRRHILDICRATRNKGGPRGAFSSIQHSDFKSITSSGSCRNMSNDSWDLSPDIDCRICANARKKSTQTLLQWSTQVQRARGMVVV